MHPTGSNYFVTLTYNDLHLPMIDGVDTLDRPAGTWWRARLWDSLGTRLPFFFVGEYGDDHDRPHYHAMVFGLAPHLAPLLSTTWPNGHVEWSWFTPTRAAYIAQYCLKKLTKADDRRLRGARHPEFAQMSRRPALGDSFVSQVLCEWLRTPRGSAWVQRYGDVPSQFRTEGAVWPIGDRHRRFLRSAAGLPATRELVLASRGEPPDIYEYPSIKELHERHVLQTKREARAEVFKSRTRHL